MSLYASQHEEAVFQTLLPQLEAEGFSVFVRPSKDMLPVFFNSFQPDAVAFKGDKKVAIEVMSQTQGDIIKAGNINEIFSAHPDWELRVVYAPLRQSEETLPSLPREMIEEHLQRIELSLDRIGSAPALLTAWAAFEAAARRLDTVEFGRPQTSARLVEVLANEGYVTPDEADVLRRVSHIRNAVAHGRLDLETTPQDLESLVAITRVILSLGE